MATKTILSKKLITSKTSPSQLIETIIKNRGITDTKSFLQPPPPVLDLKLSKAVKIIRNAVAKHQNILIYGDYDVDGITATAILWRVLHKLTPKVLPFIPHRQNDGYGVKASSFFRYQKEKGIKFDLLVTVDNGIVAAPEIQKIKKSQDIDVIVTDHHLPDPDNPPDPKLCTVVHSSLISGSAVSWFLARQLDSSADLGLAALGTVADCLPLTGVNRSVVVHGLQELRLNPSPGIKKLIAVSGIRPDSLDSTALGFVLGPRINAVGRLSDPTDALRLLCSQNQLQAARYAAVLNSFNQDRQVLQKDSLEKIEKEVDTSRNLIFMASPDFNPGIIGLIAGRLTEKYYRPSVIISIDNGVARGSCRSIPELNIIEFLREYPHLFIDLGGHALAAGFSLDTSRIPELKNALMAAITRLDGLALEPTIIVDARMDLKAATLGNIKALRTLAPFGIGNPEPLFLFENLHVTNIKVLGQTGDHLKLKVCSSSDKKSISLGVGVDAVAFKKGDLAASLHVGGTVTLVAHLSSNTWNNVTTPQLIVKEIFKN